MSEATTVTQPAGKQEAPQKTQEKAIVVLHPSRMALSEYKVQSWLVIAEEGTKPEDVVRPDFWTHCAMHLTLGDLIDVRVDTGEWMMLVLVDEVTRNYARVVPLNLYNLVSLRKQRYGGEAPAPQADLYEAVFKGPMRKWEVIRKSDGVVMQSMNADRPAAEAWIRQYERQTQ